ncbi:MAG: hypothetical protein JOZ43_03110, partial [Acidobacteriales bacterium]|nr:hypothetical protein [Terriglobales bacterium]
MRSAYLLTLLAAGICTAQTVNTPSISQPPLGFNVVPNSVRRVVANPDGNTTGYNWSVSGGCTLKNTTGAFVDVVAPASGSACTLAGNNIVSNTACTLSATSLIDKTKSSSITINVCAPQIQVSTIPFYITLYSGQAADIQSLVWGNANRNVSWQIVSQPAGGDGVLDDTNNQDTVFQATVAGRYTLKVTSVADPTKSATTTVYVTGHKMPYAVTANGTRPVDCSVDPQSSGPVYDVGPKHAITALKNVPWESLAPGSTVLIHNDDTTGSNPTTYNEYFQPSTAGTATQPIRICGVPDATGHLPVLSGINASGRANTSKWAAGYALVDIHSGNWFLYGQPNTGAGYITVEGLSVKHANSKNSYVTPSGGSALYVNGAALIRVSDGHDVVIRGNELADGDNGFFSDARTPESQMVRNLLIEGNNVWGNADPASRHHQMYTQAYGQVVQFNYFGTLRAGGVGAH